jgi:predicted nucleotide-binding protein (sugar kinase/HSP70/actin superfamily)
VQELHVPNSVNTRRDFQATCQLLQAEPYVLGAAFAEMEKGRTILRPVLNFAKGYASQEKAFTSLARRLGAKARTAREAFFEALRAQERFEGELRRIGAEFLRALKENPGSIAVALFGRPYNAFTPDINMGIPLKFATRGISVIPIDFLSCDDEPCDEHMHWASGQRILRASHFVERHPQLYGCYITNFSCGPDSFLQRFFRDIMGKKPSLTLEIDSHTADAGVNTRVEAFLDIIERYRRLDKPAPRDDGPYRRAASRLAGNRIIVSTSEGCDLPIDDSRVKLVLPSMGELLTEAAGRAFKSAGIDTVSLPQPDFEILKRGRANTSCKECLPLILITGMMDEYIEKYKSPEEVSLFFVPTAEGGCRLGQYRIFLQKYIEKNRFNDVALLSLTNENGYAGLEERTTVKVFQALIVADIWDDIRNAILALARNREEGLAVFRREWGRVLEALEGKEPLERVLRQSARRLREIPLRIPYGESPKVLIAGEIYVRKERFSSGSVVRLLADRGIVAKTAPANEWMLYVDYMIEKGIYESRYDLLRFLRFLAKNRLKRMLDSRYRRIMATSGLFDYHTVDIDRIMEYGKKLISIHVGGDPILSCGTAMKDILHAISGVIIMGPFACMQSRTTEAILSEFLTPEKKAEIEGAGFRLPEGVSGLPFLAIETDGNVLPQLIEAKLEAFALQAERIHGCIRGH